MKNGDYKNIEELFDKHPKYVDKIIRLHDDDNLELSDWKAEDRLVVYRAISLSKEKLFSIDSAQSRLKEIEDEKGSGYLNEKFEECYEKALRVKQIRDFVQNVIEEAQKKVANFGKHSINAGRKEGKGKF